MNQKFNFTAPAFALMLCQMVLPSYGMNAPTDLPQQIKTKALARETEFWQPLTQTNPSITCGSKVNFKTPVDVNTRSNTLERALYRPSHQKNKGQAVATAIPYIVCTSENVKKGKIAPKGVIIKVYGAGSRLNVTRDMILQEEKLWAAEDYMVYCLNLRGTEGFGNQFLHAQGQSHAVKSLVRDISYFTYLLKNDKKDSRGYQAIGHNFIKSDTPFYLTGHSFGGYITLCHATSDEDQFFLKDFNAKISHRTLFDGYIASMPVTDVWRDAKSGTTTGNTRLPFFRDHQKGDGWMANAFQDKNVIDSHDDNKELSPLHHMKNLDKPLLFIHGIQDTNVSPKQTVDCVQEAINHQKDKNVFLYFDRSLGHEYPTDNIKTKTQYETEFQFMEGVALGKSQGKQLKSPDNLSNINSIGKTLTRALNPNVKRPKYQFYYEAISYLQQSGKKIDQSWHEILENKSDFFLKAIVWMHEKEQINWNRQNRRVYLTQKSEFDAAYLTALVDIKIKDLVCGQKPSTSLKDFYNGPSGKGHPFATNYDNLLGYLGNLDTKLGLKNLNKYTNELNLALKEIIKTSRFGLVTQAPTVSTRFFS